VPVGRIEQFGAVCHQAAHWHRQDSRGSMGGADDKSGSGLGAMALWGTKYPRAAERPAPQPASTALSNGTARRMAYRRAVKEHPSFSPACVMMRAAA
jgi:hypothetical protein